MSVAPAVADDEVIAVETREASPAHILVKMESFSLLPKCGINDKFETREFCAGNYKWTRRFFAMKTEWGFSKFISKKVLTDPSNGYLIDDNCVFGAEVLVNENKAAIECLSLKNVTVPYKRDWKISNFSTFKDLWTCEEFTAGGHKWNIKLYPNREGDGTGHSLSIYLKYVASGNNAACERVKACYTICIKNKASADKHHKETTSYWFEGSGRPFGWPTFLPLAALNDPKGGFIVNDCCLLEIEISVLAVAQ